MEQMVFLGPEGDLYDVIIIGGGPAGASAAIYTARADLKTLVLDKGLTAGALGMAAKIANYPGIPEEISGAELVRQMRRQAEGFGATFVQEKVLSTKLTSEVKEVQSSEGIYRGRVVIIATGSMGRARSVPGEERLLGRGVSYCATCDGFFFRDQEVAVVGDNDEAAEEALFLTKFARRIHLIAPTPKLRMSPRLAIELTDHPKVEVHLATRLREVVGEKQVTGVRLAHRGEEEVLPVAGAFIYLQGGAPITDFLGDQLPKGERGCLLVDESMQTDIPGVFAAGDVLCSHVKQAVVAAAEGVIAAMAVDRYLRGRTKPRPDWGR